MGAKPPPFFTGEAGQKFLYVSCLHWLNNFTCSPASRPTAHLLADELAIFVLLHAERGGPRCRRPPACPSAA